MKALWRFQHGKIFILIFFPRDMLGVMSLYINSCKYKYWLLQVRQLLQGYKGIPVGDRSKGPEI
jgi:hypothetical protein